MFLNFYESTVLFTLQKQMFTPIALRIRNTHNEYIITNENNGTREIILNHEKTKLVCFILLVNINICF